MKKHGVVAGAVAGVAALVGAGALVLGGAPASDAAVKPTAVSQQAESITFVMRNFEKMSNGKYISHSKLPKTWKEAKVAPHETRFDDKANGRMIRFNTWLGPSTTRSQLDRKIASLKGTPGLKIVAKATVKGTSTVGQNPVRVSTVVYTYTSGKTTRWVATRYVALKGHIGADAEITVGGSPSQSKVLSKVLETATQTLSLTPTA
jgi:LysM repeat protein